MILEVGQIDVNIAVETANTLDGLIAMRIIDDGDWRTIKFERVLDLGDEMGRVDQIDVVSALVFQHSEEVCQPIHGDRLTDSVSADVEILTKTASQAASGEENGPGTSGTADDGFLKKVKVCAGNAQFIGRFTETDSTTAGDTALPGA